jgi:hypothetical protein
MIRRAAALAAVAAVATLSVRAADSADIEWLQIPEDQFYLDVPFPGLAAGNRIFYRGRRESSLHYLGHWVGTPGPFPRAEVYLIIMGARTRLTMQASRGIEYQARDMFKGHLLSVGPRSSAGNDLGDFDYLEVTLNDANCIFFLQKWTDDYRNVAMGDYCVARGKTVDARSVAKGLARIRKRSR